MGSDRRRKRDTEYQMRYWILHLEACWRVTGSRQQNLDAEQISAVTTHGLKHLEKAAGTEKSTY